jgi:hypothetical protein
MRTTRKDGGLPLWGINRDYWVRVGDEPFLDRRVLVITPWFGIFLTDIYQPDANQRDPHDHSRPFTSWVISGGYTEEVFSDPVILTSSQRQHRRWSLHQMPVSQAHVITAVTAPLRTLVFAGRSRGTWSFWTLQGKVDWKVYGKLSVLSASAEFAEVRAGSHRFR